VFHHSWPLKCDSFNGWSLLQCSLLG
jgi:hypothetical protein